MRKEQESVMFGKIGTMELLLILGIALLIFGPSKLPKLGKAIGQTIGNFKRSSAMAEKGETTQNSKTQE